MSLLSSDTPFFIVLNAASGSRSGQDAREQIQEVMEATRRKHSFLEVTDPGQLERAAEQAAVRALRESGAVIAAGGDGTIRTVAQATLPTGRPFGIIPLGTFNYTTRTHGIPLEVRDATLALENARISPTQLGTVNDQVFLVNAGVGLYPELLEDREAYKSRFGRYQAVAFWAGVRSLLREHRQLVLDIEHDRERELVRTPSLFVGNNPLQLQQVGIHEAEALAHQRLVGVVVRPMSTFGLLSLALGGALGQLAGDQRVREFSFKRMVVGLRGRRQRLVKVAMDGEVQRLKTPLIFSVAARPLLLMTPGSPAES